MWCWFNVLIRGSTLSSSLLPFKVYDSIFILFLRLSSSLRLLQRVHMYWQITIPFALAGGTTVRFLSSFFIIHVSCPWPAKGNLCQSECEPVIGWDQLSQGYKCSNKESVYECASSRACKFLSCFHASMWHRSVYIILKVIFKAVEMEIFCVCVFVCVHQFFLGIRCYQWQHSDEDSYCLHALCVHVCGPDFFWLGGGGGIVFACFLPVKFFTCTLIF